MQRWIQWTMTEDGRRNMNRPRPIQRPGVEIPDDEKPIGEDPIPIPDMLAWLGWTEEVVVSG